MCARLGRDRNIHELRRYSATELISAGVDVRTVAGRLGHGGGGTTTLRTYAAWVAAADQRAAGTIDAHMPALPVDLDHLDGVTTTPAVDAMRASNHYQRIAADLRAAITCGHSAAATNSPPSRNSAPATALPPALLIGP